MAKLGVSTFVGDGSLWLYLDTEVIIQNSDTLIMDLKEDIDYVIRWFIKGAPGSSYSITISSPKEAQFQLTKIVGSGGKDFGDFQFKY
jgi:hypothetical protein